MLRDYFWSLLAVVFLLGTYTALMFTFTAKKSVDSHLETARATISINSLNSMKSAPEDDASGGAAASMKLSD